MLHSAGERDSLFPAYNDCSKQEAAQRGFHCRSECFSRMDIAGMGD